MKIENLRVYDLEESIIASGYPMRTKVKMTDDEVEGIKHAYNAWDCLEVSEEVASLGEKDIRRCLNLTKASNGNGAHGQWMTGVRVAFDLTCTNKMWVEAERYRFLEFVSSQSTMHRIAKFKLSEQCNKYVDHDIIDIVQRKIDAYNHLLEDFPDSMNDMKKEKYLEILYNVPSGFEITARVTTNYRCLLNIYIQRKDHRLPEWREFCEYMYNNLPLFKDLVDAYESKEK